VLSAALVAALTFTGVAAHGNVVDLGVAGDHYAGFDPYSDPYRSPVPDRVMRKIVGNGPVEDVTSQDIQCNSQTAPAALLAPAKAGDELSFGWTVWPDSHVGPHITYMAKAPEGTDITTWTPTASDKVWFKIGEAGFENGSWGAIDLISNNNTAKATIPSGLPSGQYLVRHEIIALHSAGTYPGAQFYPDCFQLDLTGTGSDEPTDDFLVSFPGGYTPDTPGIAFNVYTNFDSYPIPGPAVWPNGTPSTGGASTSAAAPTSAAPTSSAVATSVETSAAPSSSAATSVAPSSSSAAAPESSSASTAASSSAAAPASSSSAAVPASSAASTPAQSSAASTPTAGLVDCNTCMNSFNQCISASQPSPDWTGCGATKDTCMSTCKYGKRSPSR
ncbi:lytic polysaccharide monooxygenase, partial [Cylindrobasidium torrendii FP15055 ss-10]